MVCSGLSLVALDSLQVQSLYTSSLPHARARWTVIATSGLFASVGYLESGKENQEPDFSHGGLPSKLRFPPLGCTISGLDAAISGWSLASPIVPIGSADGGGGGDFVRLGLTRRRISMPMTRRNNKKRIFRLVYFF